MADVAGKQRTNDQDPGGVSLKKKVLQFPSASEITAYLDNSPLTNDAWNKEHKVNEKMGHAFEGKKLLKLGVRMGVSLQLMDIIGDDDDTLRTMMGMNYEAALIEC